MAAFFIVSIQLDNPAARPLYDAYIKKVRPIVERHGGRYLVRTERLAHLAGDWRPDRVIMIRFPDRAALEANSPDPPALQKIQPRVPSFPSRLGQLQPAFSVSLYSFSPKRSRTASFRER